MKKVMVVDDDPEVRIIVSNLLSELQVNHTVASSAGECLGMLVDEPESYSMILMDIHMPTLSGLDASTWIKSSETDPPRSIPIVALTGDRSFHSKAYVSKFGMHDYVAKPVTLQALDQAVATHAGM